MFLFKSARAGAGLKFVIVRTALALENDLSWFRVRGLGFMNDPTTIFDLIV